MESCEMCGAKTKLYNCVIEGANLLVCERCSKFGEIIRVYEVKKQERLFSRKPKVNVQEELEIVDDFAVKIKDLREKQNLKQEELALKINEKVSLIHGLESKRIVPSFDIARKLQKFFGVNLIEKLEMVGSSSLDLKDQGLTIGDLIKIRKSKNQDS